MSNNSAFEASMDNATLEIFTRLVANMKTATLVVERSAKQNCPVDEGLLRADIKSEVKTSGGEIVGEVGNTIEYAPYVHQGTGIYAVNGDGRKTPWVYGTPKGFFTTKGQGPQPYLEDAKTENAGNISKILAGGG
jgi:HK97 gp10 family phage protein